MQKILFPMKVMNITQGIQKGTHVQSNAIDSAGSDVYIEGLVAPFDGVIKKIWSTGNVVWLESLEQVEFADGSKGFATLMTVHDNSVADLRVGQVIRQGQEYYQEGTAGNATGNHVHMEIAKGKFTGTGWYQNASGYWVLNNSVPPWEAFYLSGTIVINGYGYNWRTLDVLMTKDLLYWHYWLIAGREPYEEEYTTYVGKDYYWVTEEMKKYFANNGFGYYTYRVNAEAKEVALNTQIGELQTALAQKPKEVIVEKEVTVEKIVEKKVIVQVPADLDKLTVGEVFSALISKIFGGNK